MPFPITEVASFIDEKIKEVSKIAHLFDYLLHALSKLMGFILNLLDSSNHIHWEFFHIPHRGGQVLQRVFPGAQ
jgi:hypothetical protein